MASASFASGTLASKGIAMASTSGPAAANLSLHDAFAIAGLSPVLVGVVGIRWLIATVGVLLNGMLVWVTIRNKFERLPTLHQSHFPADPYMALAIYSSHLMPSHPPSTKAAIPSHWLLSSSVTPTKSHCGFVSAS